MTNSTSTLMRLNSSKQLQAPACAIPLKEVGLWKAVMFSLQLNTTQKIAIALASS
jgi:hypothetical protein